VKLQWLPAARADRTNAIDHIAKDNPQAALNQLEEIERQTDLLQAYPEAGRRGRKPGTRELVVTRTPAFEFGGNRSGL